MADNMFQIGERSFKLSKINAMKQYHIVRRIAPILGEMLPAMQAVVKKDMEKLSADEQLELTTKVAAPIMNGLSKLSDKDAEMVLYGLLAAVEIKQSEGNWAKIVVNDSLMFEDLGLPIMLQAAGRSLMFNMAGFFGALQRSS